MPLEQYSFGVGGLFAVRTDISNPTPVRFGTVQDVTVDMSFTVKELNGPVSGAASPWPRGAQKITGKIKLAKINARQFNDAYFGQTLAVGEAIQVLDEGGPGGTAIPTTPFQITVVNGSTCDVGLGAWYRPRRLQRRHGRPDDARGIGSDRPGNILSPRPPASIPSRRRTMSRRSRW
jgi:hypothetical protein